jgi:hypothetical protein
MKYLSILMVAIVPLLAGCEYESPLTEEHTLPVDQTVLGLWEAFPDEGETPDPDERMMILRYSDTEYLIHYPTGKDVMYFRAYPIKIGNVSCVQLEALGSSDGPIDSGEKGRFHVASYQLKKGELTIKILNSKIVDNKLKGSEALKQAFLKHQDAPDLFTGPETFRRLKGKSP